MLSCAAQKSPIIRAKPAAMAAQTGAYYYYDSSCKAKSTGCLDPLDGCSSAHVLAPFHSGPQYTFITFYPPAIPSARHSHSILRTASRATRHSAANYQPLDPQPVLVSRLLPSPPCSCPRRATCPPSSITHHYPCFHPHDTHTHAPPATPSPHFDRAKLRLLSSLVAAALTLPRKIAASYTAHRYHLALGYYRP